MPMPRMRRGIRACCRLEKKAARLRAFPRVTTCSENVLIRQLVFLAVSPREYQSDRPSRKLPRPRLALPLKSKKKQEENSCS
jgi:hypothetical protein